MDIDDGSGPFQYKDHLSIINIRLSRDDLIFVVGIPRHFYSEKAPKKSSIIIMTYQSVHKIRELVKKTMTIVELM